MKALIERTITRQTIETKQKDYDIIYDEHIVRDTHVLGLRVYRKTLIYKCDEKQEDSTMGFKRSKH